MTSVAFAMIVTTAQNFPRRFVTLVEKLPPGTRRPLPKSRILGRAARARNQTASKSTANATRTEKDVILKGVNVLIARTSNDIFKSNK